MARHDPRSAHRDDSAPRKGGGLVTGILIGLVVGISAAAGMAWYFNSKATPDYKVVEQAPEIAAKPRPSPPPPPVKAKTKEEPAPAAQKPTPPLAPIVEAVKPEPKPVAKPAPAPAARPAQPPAPAPAPTRPSMDYTFYGILPGDKPVKPVAPAKVQEIWWLQIAALKNPDDADRLKAKIALLGLPVLTQIVDSGGLTLHRVRVGPYKRDDDAMGHLDILSQNNFEARLLKEPVKIP